MAKVPVTDSQTPESVVTATFWERLPTPSAQFRRRAWLRFQRALDPLAQPKPLRPPRS